MMICGPTRISRSGWIVRKLGWLAAFESHRPDLLVAYIRGSLLIRRQSKFRFRLGRGCENSIIPVFCFDGDLFTLYDNAGASVPRRYLIPATAEPFAARQQIIN